MDASEIERQKVEGAELQENKMKETPVEATSVAEKSDLSDMDADKGKALFSNNDINRSTQSEVGSGVEIESNKEKGSKSIDLDGDGELGTTCTDLATNMEKEKETDSSAIGLNPSFESQQTEDLVTDANPLVDASSSDLIITTKETVSEPYDKKIEVVSPSEDVRSDQIETDQSNLECNEASDVSTAPESDTDSETESSISSIEEHDEENNLPSSLLVYSMSNLLLNSILV